MHPMIVPLLLLVLSCAAIAVGLVLPDAQDIVLIAGPSALAALILLLKALFAPRSKAIRPSQDAPETWVILDGSNVMHWKDETPRVETLHEVLTEVKRRGLTPGVVFDANAGYLLAGRFLNDRDFGHILGLPRDRVMVVPKGHPADPTILTAARDLKARIVSNDRFRDWADDHPELRQPGLLIRGQYRGDRLILDMDAPATV